MGMSFYDEHILPHLIGLTCGAGPIRRQRRLVIPAAEGRVLEVGMGAGPNLPFYDASKVTRVFGLEPSVGMRRKAAPAIAESAVDVELIDLPGEEIPLDDNSVDTVVLTYTLCTIPGAVKALEGMRRVLKPGGKLLFSEHGAAPDAAIAKWQSRIEPIWKPFGGGCHLTRDIPDLIRKGGFEIETLETGYLEKSPKWAGFNYWGSAR
jgi:ubiquinone/menaquinone biosynthesis C-methylase UbiE